MEEVKISGIVTIKKFAEGSKSERDAVYIDTGESSYILRRIGGNAFYDDTLHGLKGKHITAKGFISNYTFMAKDIKEVDKGNELIKKENDIY